MKRLLMLLVATFTLISCESETLTTTDIIPTIEALTPATLDFEAEGGEKMSIISGKDIDNAIFESTYSGSQFTITIERNEILVVAAENTGDEPIIEKVTITAAGGNSIELALTQAAKGTTTPPTPPTPPTDEGTLGEDFTLSNNTMSLSGSELSGTVGVGGVQFEYKGLSIDPSYGTIYIDCENLGYIKSTTPFSGVKEVTIIGNEYVKSNLAVYVGTTADAVTTEVVAGTSSGSGWEVSYIYTIPEEAKFISFEIASSSTHDAALKSIAFSYTQTQVGGGDDDNSDDNTQTLPDGVVECEPFLFNGSSMMEAMNKTPEDFIDKRISIIDCTFENGLYINGEQGTHTAIRPCIWQGTSTDVRIYKGNKLTFKSTDKKIISIKFGSTHNYMTCTASGYTYNGDGQSSEWRGYSSEVEFSTTEASYIDSFTVILEQ